MAKKYDVIVIGAGPGGMTAALYASRANLSVLMLDRGVYGGQMNNTAEVENYPGFKSILGPDLGQKMYDGATQFGAEYAYGNVVSVQNRGAVKLVKTDEDEYEAKAIVIATGAEHKKLGVPGEEATAAVAFHTVLSAMAPSLKIASWPLLAVAIPRLKKAFT